jgi:hypothetical protein
MVNRSVVVCVRWSKQRGRKRRFFLKEIDLDEEASDWQDVQRQRPLDVELSDLFKPGTAGWAP